MYCKVDASNLIQPNNGHTVYTIGLHPIGTFYNRSAKQTLVYIDIVYLSRRDEDILFLIYICSELDIPLTLPAVILEDNSAVVFTISNEESAYLKKCKHFIMVSN